jgi:hypothetical protein
MIQPPLPSLSHPLDPAAAVLLAAAIVFFFALVALSIRAFRRKP